MEKSQWHEVQRGSLLRLNSTVTCMSVVMFAASGGSRLANSSQLHHDLEPAESPDAVFGSFDAGRGIHPFQVQVHLMQYRSSQHREVPSCDC